ncbi:MAG: hypothetical protein GF403_05725 [Candidatus Coatesbacteria bacterium]|nr:hypothetical protein [Candidatus Coatesbacteria bacterium]
MGAFAIYGITHILALIICIVVGASKGRGGVGFLVGLFLGWIGVIIVLVLDNKYDEERRHKEMVAAATGQGGSVMVRCPHCGELAPEGKRFCPDCGGEV